MDYVYFKGKGSWFQNLFILDTKFEPQWRIKCHLTADSVEDFKALKTKTHLKKDDDGYFTNFTRKARKITRTGKELIFEAPGVFDKDGIPMGKESRIGNGSDITVKCELYQYTPPGEKEPKNAIRLASVRIDNLIPYEAGKDYTAEQAKQAEGLTSQPAPLF